MKFVASLKRILERQSYRTTLVAALVLFAIVPVLVVAGPLIQRISKITYEDAGRELSLIAKSLAQNASREMSLSFARATHLAKDSDLALGIRSILFESDARSRVQSFLKETPLASHAWLANSHGALVLAAVRSEEGRTSQPDLKALEENCLGFQKMLTLKEFPDIPAPEMYRVAGKESAIVACIPIVDESVAGYLFIAHPISKLAAFIEQQRNPMLEFDFTVNGISILKQTEKEERAKEKWIEAQAPLDEVSTTKGATPIQISVFDLKTRRFKPVRETLIPLVITLFAVVTILTGVAFYAATIFVEPINKLIAYVNRFHRSQYEIKPPNLPFTEFRHFSTHVHAMGQIIRRQIAEAREQERDKAEVAHLQMQSELNVLKSQMNPHFLFNTLNSIASMIEIDGQKSIEMVTKLSNLFRLVLESSKSITPPLATELQIVSLYLELEKVRFSDRLSYHIEAPAQLAGVHFPSLVLQTLSENAVKHGIAKSIDGGEILVKIERAEELWKATVENSGAPLRSVLDSSLSAADMQAGTGTGLANTQKRLDLLYPAVNRFEISQGERNKTVVSFFFSGEQK